MNTLLYLGLAIFVGITASLVLFALLARSARRRQLDKLGPRALDAELRRQREARR